MIAGLSHHGESHGVTTADDVENGAVMIADLGILHHGAKTAVNPGAAVEEAAHHRPGVASQRHQGMNGVTGVIIKGVSGVPKSVESHAAAHHRPVL